MASGDRYCLVWISFVKCRSVHDALPKSAILTVIRSSDEGSYGAGGGNVLGSPATIAGCMGLWGSRSGGEWEEESRSGGGDIMVTSESLLFEEMAEAEGSEEEACDDEEGYEVEACG